VERNFPLVDRMYKSQREALKLLDGSWRHFAVANIHFRSVARRFVRSTVIH